MDPGAYIGKADQPSLHSLEQAAFVAFTIALWLLCAVCSKQELLACVLETYVRRDSASQSFHSER